MSSTLPHDPGAVQVSAPPEMHEALALVQRIGGRELLERVSVLFRSSAEDRITKLQAAVVADDRTQVARLSHAMKGSAAQVGAEPLRALASALEKEADQIDHRSLDHRIEELALAAREAWAQLEQFRSIAGESA